MKRKEGVGRVLQKEGGCGKREDGVGEGGKGEGRKRVWRVRRREGVGRVTKAGREGWGRREGGK